jgi:hypothetical protein
MCDPRTEHIGTIRLEVSYVQLGPVKALKPALLEEVGVVHEKAKKIGGLYMRVWLRSISSLRGLGFGTSRAAELGQVRESERMNRFKSQRPPMTPRTWALQ